MPNLKDTSRLYLQAGLSLLPANAHRMFAALSAWKEYQKRLPTETELAALAPPDAAVRREMRRLELAAMGIAVTEEPAADEPAADEPVEPAEPPW